MKVELNFVWEIADIKPGVVIGNRHAPHPEDTRNLIAVTGGDKFHLVHLSTGTSGESMSAETMVDFLNQQTDEFVPYSLFEYAAARTRISNAEKAVNRLVATDADEKADASE